jgi:hypothetical protein
MAEKTVQEWVDTLQASGRYTFLRDNAIRQTGGSPDSVKKALQRLAKRRRVIKIKEYFFVIVPLEYLSSGCPPASWFVHDLMVAMKRPYYVGLLSAAGLHGASLQQPQEFQVVTYKPIRSLRAGRVRIKFFVKKNINLTRVISVKTPTGTMRVSSPEATALDLVRYAKAAGHLSNVATILSELVSALDARRLVESAIEYFGLLIFALYKHPIKKELYHQQF